jgi:hypothetical protein
VKFLPSFIEAAVAVFPLLLSKLHSPGLERLERPKLCCFNIGICNYEKTRGESMMSTTLRRDVDSKKCVMTVMTSTVANDKQFAI